MSDSRQLADSPYGALDYYNGELRNDTKVDDPTAYRLGSKRRAIGLITGDHIRQDGARESLIVDNFKRDERYYHAGNPLVGEKTLHLRKPGQSSADTLIETVRFDGVTYHVPIIAAAGIVGGSGGGVSSFLRSPNGRFEMEIQDDGNVVVYDEQNGHTPVSAFRIGFGV